MKHRIFLLATALMLAFSLFMAVPSAGIPLSAGLIVSHDGAIMPGEYSDTTTFGGSFELHWRNTGKDIHIAMKAPTSGWVSIGLQPDPQSAADMILGYYSGGTTYIYDMFASGHPGAHEEDTVLGGSNNIATFGGSDQGGYTIIEFERNLYVGDAFDCGFR